MELSIFILQLQRVVIFKEILRCLENRQQHNMKEIYNFHYYLFCNETFIWCKKSQIILKLSWLKVLQEELTILDIKQQMNIWVNE